VVCSGFVVPSGRAVTGPSSIQFCTFASINRRSCLLTTASRGRTTSAKLCPVLTCSSCRGTEAVRNAVIARCGGSVESWPPENRIVGRSNSPATSRKTWLASDASVLRCSTAVAVVGGVVVGMPVMVRSALFVSPGDGLCKWPVASRAGRTRFCCYPPNARYGGRRRGRPAWCTARSRWRDSPRSPAGSAESRTR